MSLVPMDVRTGNEKRKQLLMKLMQQAAQNVPNRPGDALGQLPFPARMLRPAAAIGPARPAMGDAKRPVTPLTQQQFIPPGWLKAALGPGGFGTPGHGESSIGEGAPVARPGRGNGAPIPRPAGVLIPGGTLPGLPPATAPAMGANGHIQVPSGGSFDYSNPTPQDMPTGDPAVPTRTFEGSTFFNVGNPAPAPVATTPAGLVPLGNGQFYDVKADVIRGTPKAAPTGSAVRSPQSLFTRMFR